MESQRRLDYLIDRLLDLGYHHPDVIATMMHYLNDTQPQNTPDPVHHFDKEYEFTLKFKKNTGLK